MKAEPSAQPGDISLYMAELKLLSCVKVCPSHVDLQAPAKHKHSMENPSTGQEVDLSKYRLGSISHRCSSPLHVVFIARFRLSWRMSCTAPSSEIDFLFAMWGGFPPLGTHALFCTFSLTFTARNPCFMTSNDFMKTPWVTIVIDLEERIWVCNPTPLAFLRQNMRDPPIWDHAVAEYAFQNIRWNVKCFSCFLNGNLYIFIYHGLYTTDQLFITLCLILRFTLDVLYSRIP